jgi:iron-sulfur cluster insertion protein
MMVQRDTHAIAFTEAAAHKVGDLIQEEGRLDLRLRIYIKGGGCSGFEYGFTFDEETRDDDILIEQIYRQPDAPFEKVILLVDPISASYLTGAEIDYRSGLEGEQFVVRNPNAKTTCGCGSSFSLNDQSESESESES